MTDNELLKLILSEIQGMKSEIQGMKSEMQGMKSEMQSMKSEIHEIRQKVTNLELTLENETNHNIQLLAENHLSLVDKLNQAIKVQDKSLLYEVQVSGLKMRVERLEQELADIKAKIA